MEAILKRLRGSRTGGNFAWLLAERGLKLFVGVFVGGLVARHLGPADFGILSTAFAIVGIGFAVAGFGIDQVVVRELVRSPLQADVTLGTTYVLRGGLALVVLLVILASWEALSDGAGIGVIAWIAAVLIPYPLVMTLFNRFDAVGDARIKAWTYGSGLLVAAAGRLGAIVVGAPVEWFGFLWFVEMAFATLLAWWVIIRDGRVSFGTWRVGTEQLKSLLRDGWPLMLSGLLVIAYQRVDILMLKSLLGADAAGIYSAATRFTEVLYSIPGIFIATFIPGLVARSSRGDAGAGRYRRDLLASASLASYISLVGCLVLAPPLINLLYGAAYAESISVLKLHVFAIVPTFSGMIRNAIMISEGMEGHCLAANLVGAVTNVVANLLLIPKFGPDGAAVATLISATLGCVLVGLVVPRMRALAWEQMLALAFPIPRSILDARR